MKRQEEATYQVASLFLDAEQAAHSFDAAQQQIDSLTKVKRMVDARVADGRELAHRIEEGEAGAVESQKQRGCAARESDRGGNGAGPGAGVRRRTIGCGRRRRRGRAIALPVSEDASIEEALEHSPELRRLESDMQMKMLEIKGYHAARLPKVNVVAQDNIFAKYNYTTLLNYKFRYNNPELGASVTIPLLVGKTARAYSSQAEADVAKMRIEVARTRSRITADLRRAYREVKSAESSQELARDDLDFTREDLDIELAKYAEGRVPLAHGRNAAGDGE